MLPLQLTRIFDYQQPATDMYRSDSSRVNAADGSSQTSAATEIIEERRQQTDRRALERREKQQATFLNTRKMQGRRRSAGRRANDAQNTYRPISLKGWRDKVRASKTAKKSEQAPLEPKLIFYM